ncbi:MAG: hypothetical protein M1533_00005 [Candidatus Thermoplasmatota archaeon]|jgi:hypothetical protein|nr:hypothetical protein [Candidatus Thermoplasmatota archaeon]MCL5794388.1 hypothetical protein [Candidatus Thermoplasmatota archaeon]
MKGSLLRKRYVLLRCPLSLQPRLSENLLSSFGARKKAYGDRYLIVLTDQFKKDSLCTFVEAEFPECSVITVSGSIRKCKSAALGLH